ncbi:glycosyltransferase family 15 protein [Bipolaris maydis ATCC 48331]|uniref:Glycosyltransferase family 15 protein n=2 Tax=Cochliobolus heterostrophus TaxID=5016 RepID=M2TFL7_COCH5|nr:glycosyltransferase family 15 protein [Bipolaris maydis ATCC 48331]EMD96245.1 glycosyltransferase family 15 protein [Bipolaris maydis C5]ENI11104.1 glycosyltransferase family 15 protein [Bipolaris maydis ATCC 48331]KAJ5030910.1 glycosyltransferase [Bipolaris maydis]KAJ6274255.1 glycosyltransferase [Bipolaris maydis]
MYKPTIRPPSRHPLRPLLRTFSSHWKAILVIATLMLLEVLFHIHSFTITRPSRPLDAPFHTDCQNPVANTTARENAVLLMLARNSEVSGAVASVRSVQKQFNDRFGYPWVFLNDKPWSEEFKEKVGAAVQNTSATGRVSVEFNTIPEAVWGFPSWIDQDRARRNMKAMQEDNIQYAAKEGYHHMCRFQSGFFHKHPSLLPYKYYWRVEPSISFTCAITYDPFSYMRRNRKRYAYTTALWERGKTVPSLFRKLSDYKSTNAIPTSPLWTALHDPSFAPWPLRPALAWLRNRNAEGDLWNMCHFWSNFEIGDLDFFRGEAYTALFDFLDHEGGFYYERWGDAAVHSLAVAMLLEPGELHWFSDWGYVHGGLQGCGAGLFGEDWGDDVVKGE